MLRGKCLCGDIDFEVGGHAYLLYNCHCADCRAFTGSSFATNYLIAKKDMRINDVSGSLVEFNSTPGTTRGFCGKCGSSIFSDSDKNEELRALHCGGLLGFPDVKLSTNFHTSQKCPWVEINEGTKNYESSPAENS